MKDRTIEDELTEIDKAEIDKALFDGTLHTVKITHLNTRSFKFHPKVDEYIKEKLLAYLVELDPRFEVHMEYEEITQYRIESLHFRVAIEPTFSPDYLEEIEDTLNEKWVYCEDDLSEREAGLWICGVAHRWLGESNFLSVRKLSDIKLVLEFAKYQEDIYWQPNRYSVYF